MQQPELGLRITELRKQKGLTQDELVDLCNINVRTLQRIENGEVSPRSYTIKTILSALDYDYESLHAEQSGQQSPSQIQIAPKEAKSAHTLLTMAWIAGIVFALTAIFEGISDYVRIDNNAFIFGIWGHIVIKLLIVVFNGLLLYGFLIAGSIMKNHLMKIASILMLIALLASYLFDILSIFNKGLDIGIILLAQGISFGFMGVLFGVSILKSRTILGNTGLASGIAELFLAFCLLTVILSPIALFLFFPVVVLQILVLYKVSTLVKEQLP
ncbi:MAG: helix-turn-helix transcriptional regulator [Bacteroidota bacterium]